MDQELEYLKHRLTAPEKRALQATWNRMKDLPPYHHSAPSQLMCRVFEETMNKTCHKQLFFKQVVTQGPISDTDSVIPDHGRKMEDLVDKIIACVNEEPFTQIPSLKIIGTKSIVNL